MTMMRTSRCSVGGSGSDLPDSYAPLNEDSTVFAREIEFSICDGTGRSASGDVGASDSHLWTYCGIPRISVAVAADMVREIYQ